MHYPDQTWLRLSEQQTATARNAGDTARPATEIY